MILWLPFAIYIIITTKTTKKLGYYSKLKLMVYLHQLLLQLLILEFILLLLSLEKVYYFHTVLQWVLDVLGELVDVFVFARRKWSGIISHIGNRFVMVLLSHIRVVVFKVLGLHVNTFCNHLCYKGKFFISIEVFRKTSTMGILFQLH